MAFVKATKEQAKLRLAISGPAGAGKTKTALRIASAFGRIAVIDSENGSSCKYAKEHDFDIETLNQNSHPSLYVKAIKEAESAGYDVVIIDSLTPAWEATKSEVDRKKQADKYGNGFTAWGEGTKIWNSLMDAIEGSKIHVIVTMRSKVEYCQDVENGKKVVRKLGMQPEIRDGSEYRFDAVLEMEVDHSARIGKTRCTDLDGYFEVKPTEELGEKFKAWLSDGVQATPKIDKVLRERVQKALAWLKEMDYSDEAITDMLMTEDWENATQEGVDRVQAEYKKRKAMKADEEILTGNSRNAKAAE